MSLRGYKKKYKPALWKTIPSPQEPVEYGKATGLPILIPRGWNIQRKRIAPVSKRRQKTTHAYRKAAKAFVEEAVDRGERCPVVAAVKELREGRKYGHPISDRLNEVHHMRGRAGALLMAKQFWLAVSKQGHRWIHENMAKARELGFLCALGDWGRQP